MPKEKAVGNQGNWFAKVGSDNLPCVWDAWVVSRDGKMFYDDKDIHGLPKAETYVQALRDSKQAILRKRKIVNPEKWESGGYIAKYAIDNVEYDEQGLRFEFRERLQELK